MSLLMVDKFIYAAGSDYTSSYYLSSYSYNFY